MSYEHKQELLTVLGVQLKVDYIYDDYANHLVQIDGILLANPEQDLVELFMCDNILDAVANVIEHHEMDRRTL